MTFLRDPRRVLSHYYFHAQAGAEKLRLIWRREHNVDIGDEDNVSLEEGLARGITLYSNFATRFLWGGESLEGDLPPDALERAKQNLERFAFVGVRELLDEGVILLGRMLGVPHAGYHLRHVREGRRGKHVPRLTPDREDIEPTASHERASCGGRCGGRWPPKSELLRRRAEVTENAERSASRGSCRARLGRLRGAIRLGSRNSTPTVCASCSHRSSAAFNNQAALSGRSAGRFCRQSENRHERRGSSPPPRLRDQLRNRGSGQRQARRTTIGRRGGPKLRPARTTDSGVPSARESTST